MGAPKLRCTLAAVDALTVDAVALFTCEDVRPLHGVAGLIDWRSSGALSRMLVTERFVGRARELALTNSPLPGVRRIFLFGVGEREGLRDRAAEHFAGAAQVLRDAKVESVAVVLPHPGKDVHGRADDVFKKAFGERFLGCFDSEDDAPSS